MKLEMINAILKHGKNSFQFEELANKNYWKLALILDSLN